MLGLPGALGYPILAAYSPAAPVFISVSVADHHRFHFSECVDERAAKLAPDPR